MSMLPTTSRYDDPAYAELARMAEQKYGLPAGILDAIRLRGERSNADQVSEAGARSVYQFIPSTRRGMVRNYGVDPWAGPKEGTDAAALLLLENKKRSGSWDKAIAQYHGGLDSRNHGPRTRAYTQRVGSFDGEDQMPYYGGGQPFFPPGSARGYAPVPLAPEDYPDPAMRPERPMEAAPVIADAGPSVAAPSADPAVAKRRGGILGALERIFMPSPDTLWGQALTGEGGLFHARANLENYRTGKKEEEVNMQAANAKLRNLLRNGEFQVVGNNVFHIKPDGSYSMISPPANPGEKERLIDMWRSMDANNPAKELIEGILLGANDPDVIERKGRSAQEVARIRGGSTVSAARIRQQPVKSEEIPNGWSVVK